MINEKIMKCFVFVDVVFYFPLSLPLVVYIFLMRCVQVKPLPILWSLNVMFTWKWTGPTSKVRHTWNNNVDSIEYYTWQDNLKTLHIDVCKRGDTWPDNTNLYVSDINCSRKMNYRLFYKCSYEIA
jgi:hypothetical protein